MKTFDEVYETLPGDGWLARDEAQLLYRCCEGTEGPILEVGCYKGRSTVLLASFGRMVTCVDPFAGFASESPNGDAVKRAFLANLDEREIRNVTLINKRIEDCSMFELRACGLAYLDGDHSYQGTLYQIQTALACGADCIAIHDVNDSGDGAKIKEAALEMLGMWDQRVARLAVWWRNR